MTTRKQYKEIERLQARINDLEKWSTTDTVIFSIFMIIIFLAIGLTRGLSDLQSQIDALPKKVCHNETVESYQTVVEGRNITHQRIFCDSNDICYNLKIIKEVCE